MQSRHWVWRNRGKNLNLWTDINDQIEKVNVIRVNVRALKGQFRSISIKLSLTGDLSMSAGYSLTVFERTLTEWEKPVRCWRRTSGLMLVTRFFYWMVCPFLALS